MVLRVRLFSYMDYGINIIRGVPGHSVFVFFSYMDNGINLFRDFPWYSVFV